MEQLKATNVEVYYKSNGKLLTVSFSNGVVINDAAPYGFSVTLKRGVLMACEFADTLEQAFEIAPKLTLPDV